MSFRRAPAPSAARKERWIREDAAHRLRDEVPRLADLELRLEERRAAGTLASSRYVRRIVVDKAPALFEVSCSDPSCEGGGHDLTATLLRALRKGDTQIGGTSNCHGSVGAAACERLLVFEAVATYLP